MRSVTYRLIEFLFIFFLVPLALALEFPIQIKLSIGAFGFLYIVFVLLKVEKIKFKVATNLRWKKFWKYTLVKLGIVIIATVLYMVFFNKDDLFAVILYKPGLWIIILFVYTFLSVYPQELVYRTFFFRRYNNLFKDKRLLIFINAIVFSLGHLFFRNSLVLMLTFVGGLAFAFTFFKTRSTLLVSIEHAIYGCWLFTVGMGNMLGFPS